MRLAIVSARFAPSNTIGSVTVSSLASALHDLGHDVIVVAADDERYPGTLRSGVPEAQIRRYVSPLSGTMMRVDAAGKESNGRRRRPLTRIIRRLGQALLIPDPYILWAGLAVGRALSELRKFRPSAVISSGPPHSGVLAGALLSKLVGAMHVVHFRDLWTDNPYPTTSRLRTLQRWLEKCVVSGATLVLTPSIGCRDVLLRRYPKAHVEVFRSYPRWRDVGASLASSERHDSDPGEDRVRVCHVGSLYEGRRDVVPILRELGKSWKSERLVSFEFLGDAPNVSDDVLNLLPATVTISFGGRVARSEALSATAAADVALVLTWADEPSGHSFPAKLYEIAMLRKSVLVFGRHSREIEEFLADAGLIYCVTDRPHDAVEFLAALETGVPASAAHSGDPQLVQCAQLVKTLSESASSKL